MKHLNDAVRCAGQESGSALHQQTDVDRRESVHVFQRGDRVQHFTFVEAFAAIALGGKRKLNQDSVDRIVLVQLGDQFQELLLAGVGRQTQGPPFDPGFLAGAAFVSHVNLAGRVFPHQHGSQAGFHTPAGDESRDVVGHFRTDFSGNLFSVQSCCGHRGLH